jgi:PAS domain-containing protein
MVSASGHQECSSPALEITGDSLPSCAGNHSSHHLHGRSDRRGQDSLCQPTHRRLARLQQEWLTDPERWVKQLHPIDRDRVLDAFNDTFVSGIPFKMEYRLVTCDGTSRWFQDHGVVITDKIQNRSYMYGTMVDITDRKAAET